MLTAIVSFIVGLLIGWNLLEQPSWVKNLWDRGESKVDDYMNNKEE